MKKVLFFAGLLMLCLFVGSVSAMSGSGTASNPYILTTPADLQALSGSGIAGYGASSYYELGADIDMSSVASFTPIGTYSSRFIGHFDGKNHTIDHLTISGSSSSTNVALFFTSGGAITNVIIDHANIVGQNRVAGIVGSNGYYSSGTISNCVVKNSSISSQGFNAGGICGYGVLSGTGYVNGCVVYNTTITTASYAIGGIVGRVESSNSCSISNCVVENSRIVGGSSTYGVGGIISIGGSSNCSIVGCKCLNVIINGGANPIGIISAGTGIISNCVVENCYASTTNGVAGIVYSGEGATISLCSVSNSTLAGTSYCSGIYGKYTNTAPTVTGCTVSNCAIIGTSNVAGVGN